MQFVTYCYEKAVSYPFNSSYFPKMFLLGIFCASKDQLLRCFFIASRDDGFVQAQYRIHNRACC
jgi:hypothetical protein